ncbi:MAG: CHAT domain-containing protein [Caldilineaceae bacterium]
MGDSNSQPTLWVNALADGALPWTPADLAQRLVDWITATDNANQGCVDWAALLPPLTAEQTDAVATHLKSLADQVRQSDLAQAGKVVDLLFIWAAVTANPCHRALALRAKGNLLGLGQGKFRDAIAAYDEAGQLYLAHAQPVTWAQTQIGKIEALANLGLCDEALAVGEGAQQLLVNHEQWLLATYVASNLAMCVHARRDENGAALARFTQALTFYERSAVDDKYTLAVIEQNRGLLLRDLGRFDEALHANRTAKAAFTALGYTIEAARADQNIGEALALSGRYTEAIQHIDQARQHFRQDHRLGDVIAAEIVMSDWLLRLRRFQEVIDLCGQTRMLAETLDGRFHLAEVALHEAGAYMGLGRYQQAIRSLQVARQLCLALGHEVWAARADLNEALLLYREHEYTRSLALAQQALRVLERHHLPFAEAQAQLIAAQAALAGRHYALTHELVQAVLAIAYGKDATQLLYEGHYVQGKLAQATGAYDQALAAYSQSVQALEQLQGHLMVEYRADFAADKQVVYTEIVNLYLQQGQPAQALEYTERAKSRALLDLIARGLDLRITAKDPADQHLVEALTHLRTEQNRLYHRWEGRQAEQAKARPNTLLPADQGDWQPLWQEIRALEQQITGLWNRLLVRNADYAHAAALWQVRTENIQPDLAADTLLLEYFFIHEKIVLFAVTSERISTTTLPSTVTQVESSLRFLQMNFNLAMRGSADTELVAEAQELLHELYSQLVAPVRPQLSAYRHLVIVPHGFLHKLPFHALYDGIAYLIEHHTISYLPSASLLRYCRRTPAHSVSLLGSKHTGAIAFGYGWQGQLPAAESEAQRIAALLRGVAYTGSAATVATFQAVAPTAELLHLATHGEFRADDPLYSYLLLAEGRLTTLDIFNLRLQATLVTLSACDTGQSLIGGGDELLGLLRAFLYAGAASVVVSHWRIDDAATHRVMVAFYQRLVAGESKAAALRTAQRQSLYNAGSLTHPYTWAAFFLVGDPGNLVR